MPAYDPQRDRGRPEATPASPVDALLDGLATDGPSAEGAGGSAEPATVTPLTLGPEATEAAVPAPAPPPAAEATPLDQDAESSAWSPAVTPSPVDPENDRALVRLGVIGAAVGAVALVTVLRQLRRHRR